MGFAAESNGKSGSIRPASIVDGVYDRIYERLMSLDIPPGARIGIDSPRARSMSPRPPCARR